VKNKTECILVSACLLGHAVRWHGKPVKPSPYVKKYLADHPGVQVIAVCPEQLGGLPTPRPPVKVRKGVVLQTCEEKSMRNEVTGLDVTEYFVAGAQMTLAIAKKHKCKTAILMKTSPSCARGGITGKLLIANGIEVISVY
jgi:uncharacterized protein YbbK (DUF523 family)